MAKRKATDRLYPKKKYKREDMIKVSYQKLNQSFDYLDQQIKLIEEQINKAIDQVNKL